MLRMSIYNVFLLLSYAAFTELEACVPSYSKTLADIEEHFGLVPDNEAVNGPTGLLDTGYTGRPVHQPSDLDCDLRLPAAECRWRNAAAAEALDALGFYLFARVQQSGAGGEGLLPAGRPPAKGAKVLLAGTKGATRRPLNAVWLSAPLKCLTSGVSVQFPYWLYGAERYPKLRVLLVDQLTKQIVWNSESEAGSKCDRNGVGQNGGVCRVTLPEYPRAVHLAIQAADLDGNFALVGAVAVSGALADQCAGEQGRISGGDSETADYGDYAGDVDYSTLPDDLDTGPGAGGAFDSFYGTPARPHPSSPVYIAPFDQAGDHSFLSCDFDGRPCGRVWYNRHSVQSGAVWLVHGAPVAGGAWQRDMQSMGRPDGSFAMLSGLATTMDGPGVLLSAPVHCLAGGTAVDFRAWISPNALLKVCTLEAGTLRPLECVTVPRSAGADSHRAEFGRTAENAHVAFVGEAGTVAIDDIEYRGRQCGGGGESLDNEDGSLLEGASGIEDGGDIRIGSLAENARDYAGGARGDFAAGGDLDCPSMNDECRWENHPKQAAHWQESDAVPSRRYWRSVFSAGGFPDGTFLIGRSAGGKDTVTLFSDPIECQRGAGTLTLRLWLGGATVLAACLVDGSSLAPIADCHTLTPGVVRRAMVDKGQVSLRLGGEKETVEDVRVQLQLKRGVAALGRLRYSALGCAAPTTAATTSTAAKSTAAAATRPATERPATKRTGGGTACPNLSCPLDGDTCMWRSAPRRAGWLSVTGRFGNRVTGINAAPGRRYLAAYVTPSRLHVLRTAGNVPNDAALAVHFDYFEAGAGIRLKGCCAADRKEECPFMTDLSAMPGDRRWRKASFKCSRGTSVVKFACENVGGAQGACALDKIEVECVGAI